MHTRLGRTPRDTGCVKKHPDACVCSVRGVSSAACYKSGPMSRVLLSAAAALLLFGTGLAQEKTLFRSGNQTVVLHATVRSADGRLAPDLTREDFEIRDEGQPVKISVFSS